MENYAFPNNVSKKYFENSAFCGFFLELKFNKKFMGAVCTNKVRWRLYIGPHYTSNKHYCGPNLYIAQKYDQRGGGASVFRRFGRIFTI